MIPLYINLDIRMPDLSPRNMNRVMKQVHAWVSIQWHEKILQKHFKFSATSEYGYKRRSAKYYKHKVKAKGHRSPLVWSGAMRDELMASRRVASTARTGRVTMRAPQYVLAHRGGGAGTQPNKVDEITAISDADRELMAEFAEEFLERFTTQNTVTETISARSAA